MLWEHWNLSEYTIWLKRVWNAAETFSSFFRKRHIWIPNDNLSKMNFGCCYFFSIFVRNWPLTDPLCVQCENIRSLQKPFISHIHGFWLFTQNNSLIISGLIIFKWIKISNWLLQQEIFNSSPCSNHSFAAPNVSISDLFAILNTMNALWIFK